jgi:hypothetical protein
VARGIVADEHDAHADLDALLTQLRDPFGHLAPDSTSRYLSI